MKIKNILKSIFILALAIAPVFASADFWYPVGGRLTPTGPFYGLKVPGITTGGGTECLHITNVGVISATGSDCGSGGGGGVTDIASSDGTITFSVPTGSVDAIVNTGIAYDWTADHTFEGKGLTLNPQQTFQMSLQNTAKNIEIVAHSSDSTPVGLSFGDSLGIFGTIIAPSTYTNSWTWTLPLDQGAPLTFLQNDGSGNLSWVAGSGSSDITIGTTTITSGTNTAVLFDNAGVVGEYSISGSGNVAMTTSPVFTTPNIGSATGSISGNAGTATALATGRTISITGDLAYTSGSFNGTGNVTGTGTLASIITAGGPTGSATVAPIITYDAKGRLTAVSSATITPAVGSITGLGTGVATWLATPSSANLASAITDETGSGALVFGTAPTITTSLTMADAANLIFNTTTGTKIGTATTQKLAFYNSTPIVQPTGSIITGLQNLGLIASATLNMSELTQTDVTTNNASTSAHGFLLKLDNNSAHFMDGTGAWSTPPGGSGGGSSGWSGQPLTFATNTTQYAPYAGGGLPNATETNVSTKASGSATISKLHVTLDAALGASATLQITLEDGTATASTLTCTTSSGGTSCDDVTHSVNVADLDLLSWKLVSSGVVTAGVPQIKISYAVGTSLIGTTSVSFTGGLISVATATTTPALTVAGTSGGIPYFSGASTWASSALLSANALVIGGGAGVAPSTTTTGTGILTFLGTPSSANLLAAMTDETGSGMLVFGTAPTIAGGSITALTTLAMRDTSAAFDLTLAAVSSTALTAGRTLTLDVVNAARTVKLGGNLTLAANLITSGANSLTLTTTGATNVTFPTSGTLSTATIGKYTLQGTSAEATGVVVSTTYNYGMSNIIPQSAATARRTPITVPFAGTLRAVYVTCYVRSTLGTATQTFAYNYTVNNAGSTSIGSVDTSARINKTSVTGLSTALVAGDDLEVTFTTPAVLTSSPTNMIFTATFLIEQTLQ